MINSLHIISIDKLKKVKKLYVKAKKKKYVLWWLQLGKCISLSPKKGNIS